MKITCRKCAETFELPDGKAVEAVYCPFCETKNPTKKAEFQEHKQKHPLDRQFWIIAGCAMILTTLLVLSWIRAEILIYKSQEAANEIIKAIVGK